MVTPRRALLLAALSALLVAPTEARAREPHSHTAHEHDAAAKIGPTPGPHDATSRHSFEAVEKWVAVFDDPARDAWQKPAEVVSALHLQSGMKVADLGAGTGYFLRHLSNAVGSDGWVFAVDTEPRFLEYLRERAEREGVRNSTPVLASAHDPRLPRRSVDLIFIVDTFHHIDDRVEYAKGLRGLLAPGGRIAIIDWKRSDLPVGPPLDHKLAREQVIGEMVKAGYELAAAPDLLPYQYFLIFTVPTGRTDGAGS